MWQSRTQRPFNSAAAVTILLMLTTFAYGAGGLHFSAFIYEGNLLVLEPPFTIIFIEGVYLVQ